MIPAPLILTELAQEGAGNVRLLHGLATRAPVPSTSPTRASAAAT
jgi:hypothetical protein